MKINYTNWRGENADRNIIPLFPYYGSNEWHPEKQGLLRAWDIDKKCLRSFAVKDIRPADFYYSVGKYSLSFTWFRIENGPDEWRYMIHEHSKFCPLDPFILFCVASNEEFHWLPKGIYWGLYPLNEFYWLGFEFNIIVKNIFYRR